VILSATRSLTAPVSAARWPRRTRQGLVPVAGSRTYTRTTITAPAWAPNRRSANISPVNDHVIDHYAWLKILGPLQSRCAVHGMYWRFATSTPHRGRSPRHDGSSRFSWGSSRFRGPSSLVPPPSDSRPAAALRGRQRYCTSEPTARPPARDQYRHCSLRSSVGVWGRSPLGHDILARQRAGPPGPDWAVMPN